MEKIESKNLATDYNIGQKNSLQSANIIPVAKPNTIKNLPPTQNVSSNNRPQRLEKSSADLIQEQNTKIEKAKDFLATKNINMSFSEDKETGQTIIKFLDTKTNEVIKQMPTPEMLSIARSIDEFLNKSKTSSTQTALAPNIVGLILNERA